MLGLKLRQEFNEKRLKGTAIELIDKNNTGATQVSPIDFLKITYPTFDILKGIEAICNNDGRPIVVIGERGCGKSHLMAVLYHTVNNPDSTQEWLDSWFEILQDTPNIKRINIKSNMKVIGDSLHRQNYKFLWDVLFEQHPKGGFYRGKWEGMGVQKTDVPPFDIILEMLQDTPVMLVLDEFQTWYDGLKNSSQGPQKNWAFNFIQILTDISSNHPQNLILIVSVRNGESNAYQQIHRVNPVRIDFKTGGNREKIIQNRRNMLLYRLFENRLQIAKNDIENLIEVHVTEYLKLLDIPTSEHERKRQEFIDSWPFAPTLLQILEDQILIATDAQESRDLIRILASLFKVHGAVTPILTAADFHLEDNDDSGIGALLNSVANQHHRTLREKALRNLTSVSEAIANNQQELPNLKGILSSLWLRSISVESTIGAEAIELHSDITKDIAIDHNSFQVELDKIVENSFNIHLIANKFVFKEEENPQAKLMAIARNDRLFADQIDYKQLANEIRYVISGPSEFSSKFRIIVLHSPNWITEPWSSLEESERPEKWDNRIPIIVLPESNGQLNEQLGLWLKDHVARYRNTIRFLLPNSDLQDGLFNRSFRILARAISKAHEWSNQNIAYRKLGDKLRSKLHDELKKCFDRFAILHNWDFSEVKNCEFHTELIRNGTDKIPQTIEKSIIENLFVPEDFEEFMKEAAKKEKSIGSVLEELREPQPAGHVCIPWLGEVLIKEQILRICSKGKISINVRGSEFLQLETGESEEQAWNRLKSSLPITGRQLDEVFVTRPRNPTVSGDTDSSIDGSSSVDGSIDNNYENSPSGYSGEDETFKSTTITNRPEVKSWIAKENPATSALNLIAELEKWGVGPATPVKDTRIKLTANTGAQVESVLKNLPDGMTFELSLLKGETDDIKH